ncbi:TatD family hydrolase, partial [Candidatus Saccharibacteria bacterium]|nr:TatD family hydrolase [Candidatus Saccharibacteria bacterium]
MKSNPHTPINNKNNPTSSPYLIDSHCHLHDKSCFPNLSGPESPESILAESTQNGVKQIIVIGTNHQDSIEAQKFAESHENVYYTYGIHPEYAKSHITPFSDCKEIASTKLVAIGEVGLDYHYKPYDRQAQIALLEEMLDLAKSLDLPLTFHIREAFDDFFPIVENHHIKKAVIHSFSDNKKNLEKALNHDFYIG